MHQLTAHNSTLKYYEHGDDPKLLILSGTHGNERESIESIQDWIKANLDKLPPFIYIPEISPSAIAAYTRQNYTHRDINRKFFNNSDDNEVIAVTSFLSSYKMSLCMDFHEDLQEDSFYMYDSGQLDTSTLDRFRKFFIDRGEKLFSGIDDVNDPILAYEVIDGYIANVDVDNDSGCLTDWLLDKKIVNRSFTFEIPGKVSFQTKHEYVDHVFEFFLALFGEML